MAKRNDWELIEQEYRTGRFSLVQLEARRGVSRPNISRRAKKFDWKKDLTERVRESTQERITRATLPPEAQKALAKQDDAVIESAANENVAVVKGHRKTLERFRGIADRYVTMLEEQLAESKLKVEVQDAVVEIDLPLEHIGKCMGYIQALERVAKLERQNYGLHLKEDDSNAPEAELSDDDLETRITKLTAQIGGEQ